MSLLSVHGFPFPESTIAKWEMLCNKKKSVFSSLRRDVPRSMLVGVLLNVCGVFFQLQQLHSLPSSCHRIFRGFFSTLGTSVWEFSSKCDKSVFTLDFAKYPFIKWLEIPSYASMKTFLRYIGIIFTKLTYFYQAYSLVARLMELCLKFSGMIKSSDNK